VPKKHTEKREALRAKKDGTSRCARGESTERKSELHRESIKPQYSRPKERGKEFRAPPKQAHRRKKIVGENPRPLGEEAEVQDGHRFERKEEGKRLGLFS